MGGGWVGRGVFAVAGCLSIDFFWLKLTVRLGTGCRLISTELILTGR